MGRAPRRSPCHTPPAAAAYAARDDCITFQLTEAGPQPQRLALAAVYDGLGVPGLATVALYLHDATQTGPCREHRREDRPNS